MTLKDLKKSIKTPIFFTHQVQKVFINEEQYKINIALSRMVSREDLVRIKRGLYKFPNREIDELTLAGLIYQPSYVSLESALKIYGMLPEEVMSVTSVTPTTTKKINSLQGRFLYTKIQSTLFFGYDMVSDSYTDILSYKLAQPEKALLDYVYVRQVKDLESARIDVSELDLTLLKKYVLVFPTWVQDVLSSTLEKRRFNE